MDEYEKEKYSEAMANIISTMIDKADEEGKKWGLSVRSITLRDKEEDHDWEMHTDGPLYSLSEIAKEEGEPTDWDKFIDDFNREMEEEGISK